MGMSMLDALDTMWLMGMHEEFREAQAWLAVNLDFEKVQTRVSVFETSIRAIGGLLAAYDLSNDSMFMTKAKDLADRLTRHRCLQTLLHTLLLLLFSRIAG